MNAKNKILKNWVMSFLIIILMVISGFIGMAGAAEENDTSNENSTNGTSAVVGKVMNVDGKPLEGVLVVLIHGLEQSDPAKIRKLEQKTNERGMFEFKDLPRGVYGLEVIEEDYEPWFETIKVPAGEIVEVKVVLKKVVEEKRFGIVVGWVFNALDKEPIPGAHVVVFYQHGDERKIETKTDREGHFEIRVPIGEHTIYVEADGFEPYKEFLVVKSNDEIKLEIPLKPLLREEPKPEQKRPMLSGHIYDAETDKPILGWVELSYGDPENDRVLRERIEQNKLDDYFLWRTYSNRKGFYSYDNLPPGHYEMRVFAKGHIMYYNEINVRDEPLYIDVYLLREECPPPLPPVPIEPYSVISGRVLDSTTREPVAGAMVCVAPPEIIKKLLVELKKNDIKIDALNLDDIKGFDDLEVTYKDLLEQEIDMVLKDVDSSGEIFEPINEKDPETRGENDPNNEPMEPIPGMVPPLPPPEPEPDQTPVLDLLKKFCTRTDERGFFKLRIPPGANILIVKARGYEPFVRKFEIKPWQSMEVKVPLKPGENDNPRPQNSTDSDKESEGINTLDVLSGVTSDGNPTNHLLGVVLGILIIIAIILSMVVLKKRTAILRAKPKKIKRY